MLPCCYLGILSTSRSNLLQAPRTTILWRFCYLHCILYFRVLSNTESFTIEGASVDYKLVSLLTSNGGIYSKYDTVGSSKFCSFTLHSTRIMGLGLFQTMLGMEMMFWFIPLFYQSDCLFIQWHVNVWPWQIWRQHRTMELKCKNSNPLKILSHWKFNNWNVQFENSNTQSGNYK